MVFECIAIVWLAGFGYCIVEELVRGDAWSTVWYDLVYVLGSTLWPIAAAIEVVEYLADKAAEIDEE